MGKVTFKDPVDTLSGQISKNRPTIYNLGHVGVRRGKQWTTQICNERDMKTNPLTDLETRTRRKFKEVRLAVKGIKTNDTKYAQAVLAYQSVKDQYKSFDSYLWKTEGAKWETENVVED